MASTALTRWVLVASAAVLALVGGVGAAVAVTNQDLQDVQRRQSQQLDVARQADAQLLQGFVDEETGLRGYVLTGVASFLEPYSRAQASLPATMRTFRTHFTASGGPAGLALELDAAHSSWLSFAGGQVALVDSGRVADARTIAATGRGKDLFDDIRTADAAVSTWLQQASARTQHRLAELQHRLSVLLVVLLTALVLVVVAGCGVLWRAVARPLARLAAATRAVAGGDLAADLPAGGAPEMRSLAADVRAMRDRLTAELHTARRALEALEQTGPTVSALRAALEPAGEGIRGIAVAGRLDPAEGVLAGDWYDTLALGPDRLALVLGDVAGHGPAAAVFALRLKHSLTTALRAGLQPGDALTRLAAQLAEVPPGQFATVLVAVVDTTAGTVAYANAGHPAGLLLTGPAGDDDGAGWSELSSTGPLLSSIVHGWAWNTAVLPFRAGDALLAFTDGVPESRGADGGEFGTAGILRAVREVGTDDGERLVEAIAAATVRFGGEHPRRDDHTVVLLRRTGDRPVRAAVA